MLEEWDDDQDYETKCLKELTGQTFLLATASRQISELAEQQEGRFKKMGDEVAATADSSAGAVSEVGQAALTKKRGLTLKSSLGSGTISAGVGFAVGGPLGAMVGAALGTTVGAVVGKTMKRRDRKKIERRMAAAAGCTTGPQESRARSAPPVMKMPSRT
eukprot:gnl/TRDRNA2_/TRDRNA2_168512_c0_seq1.p1 gnl/TRDRNA2_/TRDRNA2_168512_c0~~gnl/TRDRNA2_/TRDRNA2_168512_c0_seq1.p1  ORF type:complete len:160 (+),score=28.43 gnl/TRDRNA2_/TRDRNA2_168512_c0_seq1:183-662(+)